MAFDTRKARDFVQSVDLRGTPRSILHQDAATEAGAIFDTAKAQAQVVGSGLFSFAQGVTPEVREAISDSALLAQLVANKRTPVEQDPLAWFTTYSDVLQNVGWTIQDAGLVDYTNSGTAAEVNEKVLEVVTAALGPGATALVIITSAMNALKAMTPDTSWITIFSRESQKARIARFQIGLVETGPNDDVFVSLFSFLIEADNTITQVLFFKFREAHATFKARNAKVSINRAALTELGPAIRAKVRAYVVDYLSSIQDI